MRSPRRCESIALLWSIACASRQAESTHEPTVEPAGPGDTARRSEPRADTRSKRSEWGKPEITRAQLTSPNEITLYFSEPVAPSSRFDPSQFRLSLGGHYSDVGYSMTYYYDIGEIAEPEGTHTSFVRLDTLDDATLRLVLSAPLGADVCDADASYDDDTGKEVAGLFLHFDRRDDAGIVDRDGNHLKDIAEAWVLRGAAEAMYYGVQSHRIRALGPIPCASEAEVPQTP